MTNLTPEQVAKLRLPEGYTLGTSADHECGLAWFVIPPREWSHRTMKLASMARLAKDVANGHLPPESLDDVWRRVEGKPSREAELLRAVTETHTAAVKASAAARAACCDDMEWAQRDADEQEAGEEFRSAMAAARKWIEEQKP